MSISGLEKLAYCILLVLMTYVFDLEAKLLAMKKIRRSTLKNRFRFSLVSFFIESLAASLISPLPATGIYLIGKSV